ncbi:MAG: copper resistance protein CopC [Paenibacillaceae bacterium]
MLRRLRITLCTCLLVLSLIPIQAFGHTKLVEMDPKPDSRLEQSPDRVLLLFNQKLEAITEDTLVVKDDIGKLVATSPAEIGAEGKSIQLVLPDLPKGTYAVHYHVISLDGHMVEGNYAFIVLKENEQAVEPTTPEAPPIIPDEQAELEAPIEVTPDYGVIPIEGAQSWQDRWTSVFTETAAVDLLHMVYFIIFLLFIGMLIWNLVLSRGRSEEDSRRHRNWIIQVQRIHLLVLIAVIVEFVQQTVGFDDWLRVQDILLSSTAGISWSVLFVLSLLGLGVLQRNRFVDVVWILALVITKTQIGHPAASNYRFIISSLTAIHLLAAALWAGGLLYLILLWSRYRQEAEKLILRFSNASLIAITLLVLSGIVNSMMYLADLSYIFETRWGLMLLIKVVAVVIVILLGTWIRRRFIRNGLLHVSTWIKLDFVMLIVIASLAALLTTAEPNPPNEPLHWHVMGNEIHMTAEITPKAPGDNRFAVSVWLPEHSGDPKSVSMQLAGEPDGDKEVIVLMKVNGTNDYGFVGFNEYTYQAETDQLDHAGIWLIDITVTDQQGQSWVYSKQIRVY